MKYFGKMNVFSLLAALPLALFTILEVNVYRLARVMELKVGFWTNTASAAGWIATAVGLVLLPLYVRRHLPQLNVNAWLLLMWLPYYVIIVMASGCLLPDMQPGDSPGAGAGMLLILLTLMYPIYILVLLMLSQFRWDFGRSGEQELERGIQESNRKEES